MFEPLTDEEILFAIDPRFKDDQEDYANYVLDGIVTAKDKRIAKAAALKTLREADNHLTLILTAQNDYMDRIFILSDYRLKLKAEIERLEKGK